MNQRYEGSRSGLSPMNSKDTNIKKSTRLTDKLKTTLPEQLSLLSRDMQLQRLWCGSQSGREGL